MTGNYFSNIQSKIKVIYKWNNCSVCQSEEKLAEYTKYNLYAQMYAKMAYIDFNDIDVPIKHTFLDKYYAYLNPKEYTNHDIFIQKNEYTLYDNYLFSNPKKGSFYSISNDKVSASPMWDGYLGQTTFYLDNRVQHYERRVYNLYDMISDIGGINQVLMTLCMVLMGIYTNRIYEYFTANEYLMIRFKNERNLKVANQIKEANFTERKIHPSLLQNESNVSNKQPKVWSWNLGVPHRTSCKLFIKSAIQKEDEKINNNEARLPNKSGRQVIKCIRGNILNMRNYKAPPVYIKSKFDKISEESDCDKVDESSPKSKTESMKRNFSFKILVYTLLCPIRWN